MRPFQEADREVLVLDVLYISGEVYILARNPHLFSPGGSDVWIKQGPLTPLFSSPPGRTCLYGTEQHSICYI